MTSSSSTKTFILDTNVILHDSACINNFQEHDIVIPITVLEELDQFKKGNQTLNYHAREFVRALDTLSAGKLLNGGVRIGPDKGRVSIKLEQVLHEDLRQHFPAASKPDHQILNIGYHLARADQSRRLHPGDQGRQSADEGQSGWVDGRGLHHRPRQGYRRPLHRLPLSGRGGFRVG